MVNVGIKGRDLGLECCNLWPQPGGNGQSMFQGVQQYLDDPLGVPVSEIPLMITFPSLKDRSRDPSSEHHTAQILALAKAEWFGAINTDAVLQKLPAWKVPLRNQHYESVKAQWKDRLMTAFLAYFPQLDGKMEIFDVSTPLTIEHYLPTGSGSAIGLDVNAGLKNRFTDMDTMQMLDMKTPIDGLWMTGQDTLLVGVPLAQAAGLMTALRIAGPWGSIQFLFRSIWLLVHQLVWFYPGNATEGSQHKDD